jgi:hypothetical protein
VLFAGTWDLRDESVAAFLADLDLALPLVRPSAALQGALGWFRL